MQRSPAPIVLTLLVLIVGTPLLAGAAQLAVSAGPRVLGDLAPHRDFKRLWGAHGLSSLGDWVYVLAVSTTLAMQDRGAQLIALLLVLQVAPAALTGLLAGSLVDRLSRRWLMIVSDVVRALAVASLLFAGGEPSTFHLGAVAVTLGVFGALFNPCLHASLPNVVPQEQLLKANAVLGATFNASVMIGPAIGGVIASQLGGGPAFAINAASFALSGVLIALCSFDRAAVRRARTSAVRELRDGVRFVMGAPLARTLVVLGAIIMCGAALKAPVEPVLVIQTLAAAPHWFGLVGAAWGLGMVLGSMVAPWIARHVAPGWVLTGAISIVAVAVVGASQVPHVGAMFPLWLAAGLGNGAGVVIFETFLQQSAPDHLRGRVVALADAMMEAGYLVGATAAGWIAVQSGNRTAMFICGLAFAAAGVAAFTLTRRSFALPPAVPAARPRAAAAAGARVLAFETVPSGGRAPLLRIETEGAPVPPVLLVDDGRAVHRVEALPGLVAAASKLEPVRAGYAPPPQLWGRAGLAFALDLGDGRPVDLPAPVTWTAARTPRAGSARAR